MTSNIYKKLSKLQQDLKVPKKQFSEYGGYSYRNLEDILEVLKPKLSELELIILLSDSIINSGNNNYIEATATLVDLDGNKISVKAMAREDEQKKKFDNPQLSGSASSYARKYALNGLLAIDDTKDSDSMKDFSSKEDSNNQSNQTTQNKQDNTNYIITENQLKRLYAIANKAGFKAEIVKEHTLKRFRKEPSKLTKQEYDQVCDGYEKMS